MAGMVAGGRRGLSEGEVRQLAGLQGAQLDLASDLAGLNEKAIDAERGSLAACDAACKQQLCSIVVAHYTDFIAASQVRALLAGGTARVLCVYFLVSVDANQIRAMD